MTLFAIFWLSYAVSAAAATVWTLHTWFRVRKLNLPAPVTLWDEVHPLTRQYVAFSCEKRSPILVAQPPKKRMWAVLGLGLVPGVTHLTLLAQAGVIGYLGLLILNNLRKPDSGISQSH